MRFDDFHRMVKLGRLAVSGCCRFIAELLHRYAGTQSISMSVHRHVVALPYLSVVMSSWRPVVFVRSRASAGALYERSIKHDS
jgi:hypothetical protein